MNKKILPAAWICLAFIVAGCASQGRNLDPAPAKTFVPFAGGVTAARDDEDPEITGAERLPVPGAARTVDTLAVHPRRLEIKAGEVFSLKKLIITALGSDGKPVRRIPFFVGFEAKEPRMLEIRPEKPEWVRGLRPGTIDLRFVSRAARPDGTHPAAYVTLYIRP